MFRLHDTIPKNCRGRPSQALAHGIDSWRSISAFFAINYWRLRALANEAIVAMHVAPNSELGKVPSDAPHVLADHAIGLQARLVALDRAVDTVCAENGIDPDDIRLVSATGSYKMLVPKLEADERFQNKLAEAIQAALD